jgi:hypothetical protein
MFDVAIEINPQEPMYYAFRGLLILHARKVILRAFESIGSIARVHASSKT